MLFAISQRQQDVEHGGGHGQEVFWYGGGNGHGCSFVKVNISVHDISITDILYPNYLNVKRKI
jgi:hypothetical protein